MGNTATASSECESWTKHNRISDGIRKLDTILYRINNLRCGTRLTDLLHRILECLTILSLKNRFRSRTDQLYSMLLKESRLGKLHTKI